MCTTDSNDIEWRKLDGVRDEDYTRALGKVFSIFYINEKHNGIYACFDRKTNTELKRFNVFVRGSGQEPTQGPSKG